MWKKTDSFQDTKKWINWLKCRDHVQKVNAEKFAGYGNWRLPNQAEAWSLFDLTQKNRDKYGDDLYLHPVFEPGSAGVTWTSDTRDSAALIIQYEDGGQIWPSQYANLNMAVRLVRDLLKN
ncbi:MAG: DUF1566 domain-containing protein, partial [Nitrospinae bacterium]|nr:DUF1566 domain-containing protein [Nitrospinota bacterium]